MSTDPNDVYQQYAGRDFDPAVDEWNELDSPQWEGELMTDTPRATRNPHYACSTVSSPPCPTGEHECIVCGKPVFRNGRRELVHCDYLNVANDHAARLGR